MQIDQNRDCFLATLESVRAGIRAELGQVSPHISFKSNLLILLYLTNFESTKHTESFHYNWGLINISF